MGRNKSNQASGIQIIQPKVGSQRGATLGHQPKIINHNVVASPSHRDACNSFGVDFILNVVTRRYPISSVNAGLIDEILLGSSHSLRVSVVIF
jgi:hypothetical protein